MGANQAAGAKSMEKLSSGLRINRAGDDAAGLAISEKMRGQIRGLKQASRNAQDGISLIQTAEGNLNETHAILQRMRELAVQGSNDTNQDSVDREAISGEIEQLKAELDRIGTDTEFNGQKLLNGDIGAKTLPGSDNAAVIGDARADDAGKLTPGGAGNLNAISTLVDADAKMVFTVDGKEIAIDLSYDATDNLGNATNALQTAATGLDTTNELSDIATALETDLNAAIANYNNAVPESEQVEDVTVTVQDGKLVVQSGSTDARSSVKFDNSQGAQLLGLANASSSTQGGGIKFQIGANADQSMQITIADMRSDALGVADIDLSTREGAEAAITTIQSAIDKVSTQRSKLGSFQNRLEHTISNLGTSAENLQAAESRIRDLDMAEEIMAFTKNNILQQAATAMLAQANMAPQSVLQLLG